MRLQVGSAIALGVGLVLSAVLLANFLEPLQASLARFLFSPADLGFAPQDLLSEIVMLFLVALMVGATAPHVAAFPATALTILYAAMYLSYAYQKLGERILTRPLYPLLALLLTLILTRLFRYFSVERRRDFISHLFRHAVPPESVDRVTTVFDTNALPLRGTRRTVSVMYVDLRDLRLLTDTLPAEQLIELLNRFVGHIVATVFQHEGFVTKQAGDTTLAAWNLVFDQPDHALRAARAAMEIKHTARALVKEWTLEPPVEIGIGVATGYVIAGHIATARLAEFAIIGEVVTLAERMAMKTDRGVFVDPFTRAMIEHEFDTQEVNPIRLRRKTDPQIVWEIIEPMEPEEVVAAEAVAEPN
ncbi:MAG: adenylate/guanylate cyclase domain-containing protein [Chloroflexi bacterium]|nr:adenylate/guanylate cyclase domain-containing protein [Chloroflexota bacterium]